MKLYFSTQNSIISTFSKSVLKLANSTNSNVILISTKCNAPSSLFSAKSYYAKKNGIKIFFDSKLKQFISICSKFVSKLSIVLMQIPFWYSPSYCYPILLRHLSLFLESKLAEKMMKKFRFKFYDLIDFESKVKRFKPNLFKCLSF